MSAMPVVQGQQFGRACKLLVANAGNNALDLSALHIKFVVKRSTQMTPNVADIFVYNVEAETAKLIQKEFTRVILQGGYETNFGVIFQGNIKQVIIGRESGTDTFIEIIAGDGDNAYNFAVVSTSLAAGATQTDIVKIVAGTMSSKGVLPGHLGEFTEVKLPRGKVMYGNARNYLRTVALTTFKNWSIQDEKVTFVDNKSYLPGEAVVLTSKTGMIGTPSQTTEGVNVKCLMNPNIKIGGRIKIDNASIAQYKLNLEVVQTAANYPAPLTADGVYFVLVVEHAGDNRGQEWYSTMLCLNMNITTNPLNAVQGAH